VDFFSLCGPPVVRLLYPYVSNKNNLIPVTVIVQHFCCCRKSMSGAIFSGAHLFFGLQETVAWREVSDEGIRAV
jgi:hypothetical protein